MQISLTIIIIIFLNLLLSISLFGFDTDNMMPMQYNVSIIPHIGETTFNFSGEAYIIIEILLATSSISLNILGIQLKESATWLATHGSELTYEISNYFYIHDKHVVDISFRKQLQPGIYILYLNFTSDKFENNDSGLLRHVHNGKDKSLAWMSQKPFPSLAVRHSYECPVNTSSFKCMEYQDLPCTFHVIVRHDYKYTARSNMPLVGQYVMYGGVSFTHFNRTSSMSSTSVTIVVFNFINFDDPDDTITTWFRRHANSRMQLAYYISKRLRYQIGRRIAPDEVPKTDLVAVPKLPTRYFATKGLILYNEKEISDNTTAPYLVPRGIDVTSLITEGLLGQTFGDSFSSDTWLARGIQIFYRIYFVDQVYANAQVIDLLVIESLQGSLSTDNHMESLDSEKNNYRQINTDNRIFNEIIYSLYEDKAPVIVRMLQHIVSEKIFLHATELYLQKFAFQSLKAENLWSIMQYALNQRNSLQSNLNVSEVMNSWVKHKHYPLVMVNRDYQRDNAIITQRNSNLEKEGDIPWWTPVTYTTQTERNFDDTLPKLWLNPSNPNVTIYVKSNNWLIVNIQQIGYYRVNYDNTNWLKIANYLNFDDYQNIYVVNRAQLIDDAFYFMYYHNLDSSIFFNITTYLHRETDYVPWYPMFKILSKLQKYFDFPKSKPLKTQIAGYFNAILNRFLKQDLPNENQLRKPKYQNATYWACTVGNVQCLNMAKAEMEKHLANPDELIETPYMREWIYCFGLKIANKKLWRKVWELYEKTREKKLLKFLACSINANIINMYLHNISLSDMGQEQRAFAFRNIVMKHARTNHTLNYILDNFKTLKPKSIDTCDAFREIISNVYSRIQLDRIKNSMETIAEETCRKELESVIKERIQYIDDTNNEYFTRIMKKKLLKSPN